MEGALVPSYTKPYSKITSWAIPMIYLLDENQEYITDLAVVVPIIRKSVRVYKNVTKIVMRTDLRGYAESFKVHVMSPEYIDVPISEFVREVSNDNELGELTVNADLLGDSGFRLIDGVYEILDRDLREVIATPLQWLVYAVKQELLTRLCWVTKINGKVKVRPYGNRNILLEVEDIKLDKVNTPSLKTLKRNIVVKQRINDYWRRKLSMELAKEELEGLGLPIEEPTESNEEASEVGEVE